MVVLTGKVVDGKVVVEGEPLPEGMTVSVVLPTGDEEPFDLTEEQWAELDVAIAEADSGDVVPASQVIAELRTQAALCARDGGQRST